MSAIGVDGCKNGWFYFTCTDSGPDYGVAATFAELLEGFSADDTVLIDIPIGLPDAGIPQRSCDAEARRLLQKRASSVFPAPARSALAADSYEEAVASNRVATGRKISRQTWGLAKKIKEVDGAMRGSPLARSVVREAHPEVCFWGLAGGRPMRHYKKSQPGFEERLGVLMEAWPRSGQAAAEAFLRYSGYRLSRDDVMDALVVMVTAMQPRDRLRTLPARPATDSQGLPMEMVYALR